MHDCVLNGLRALEQSSERPAKIDLGMQAHVERGGTARADVATMVERADTGRLEASALEEAGAESPLEREPFFREEAAAAAAAAALL